MNTASRLKLFAKNILKSKKTFADGNITKNTTYFETLKDVFDCDDVFCVYECLHNVNEECKRLEKETKKLNVYNPSKKTINTFKKISSPLNISVPIDSIQKELDSTLLHSMDFIVSIMEMEPDEEDKEYIHSHKAIYCEDDIDLSEFSDAIEKLIEDILSSEMENNTKRIFVTFLYDLKKGVKLYSINGITALTEAVEKNICKYKLIEPSLPSKYKDFKDKVSTLISEVMFWAKTVKDVKNSYKAIKEATIEIIKHKEEE